MEQPFKSNRTTLNDSHTTRCLRHWRMIGISFLCKIQTPTKKHKHTHTIKQTNKQTILYKLQSLSHHILSIRIHSCHFHFHFINSSIELLNNYQRNWKDIHTRKYKTGAPKCAAQTVLLEDLMSQCDRMWIVYFVDGSTTDELFIKEPMNNKKNKNK